MITTKERFDEKFPLETTNFVTHYDSILAFVESEKAIQREEDMRKVAPIFRWLLGMEGDFPVREEGWPNYYWRSFLEEKLVKVGLASLTPNHNGAGDKMQQ